MAEIEARPASQHKNRPSHSPRAATWPPYDKFREGGSVAILVTRKGTGSCRPESSALTGGASPVGGEHGWELDPLPGHRAPVMTTLTPMANPYSRRVYPGIEPAQPGDFSHPTPARPRHFPERLQHGPRPMGGSGPHLPCGGAPSHWRVTSTAKDGQIDGHRGLGGTGTRKNLFWERPSSRWPV